MLLSSCTTVERVEKLSEEGAEYSRRDVSVREAAALGNVRAEFVGRRLAAVRALLATAPVVERSASISRFVCERRLSIKGRKALPPAPTEQRTGSRVSQAAGRARLFHEERRGLESVGK